MPFLSTIHFRQCKALTSFCQPRPRLSACAGAARRHMTQGKNSEPWYRPTYSIPFAVGTTAGVAGSLAGMGGGFIMIPLMTSRYVGLTLTQHQAHGTSLFAVMSTGVAGALSYGEDVQYESAVAIAITGMISATLGARMASRMSGQALKRALGALMLAMAPAVHLKAYVLERDTVSRTEAPLENTLARKMVPPATIGLVSGFLAGVFGVGGGVIVVPALALATDMTHHQALATSLAAMSLPAAVGTYTHYKAGNVIMRVAPALAIGAFAGAYLGGQVGGKTNESTLRWGFSGLLTVLGIRTILKA